jgi:phospho-N-acetylmuramoyl-pentapeptide-transferase
LASRIRLDCGVVLYFSPNVTVRTDTGKNDIFKATENVITQSPVEEKSTATTIPFSRIMNLIMPLLAWTGEGYENGLGCFIPVVIFYYHRFQMAQI